MGPEAEAVEGRGSAGARLRVGFLAQENLPVPPPALGGSVSRVIYELANPMTSAADVAVAAVHGEGLSDGTRDGVSYVYVEPRLDARPHAVAARVRDVHRKLDLPHRELQGLPFYSARYARRGLELLQPFDPNVVHVQNVSQFLNRARHVYPRATLALHMHCDWLRELPPKTARRWLRNANLILGVSDYITNGIRDTYPEFAERCRTLHNGVNPDVFPAKSSLSPAQRGEVESLRRELGIDGGPTAVYVGALAPEKGIHVLLDAFSSLLRELPSAKLILAGQHNRYFQVRAPRTRAARAALRRRQDGYRAELANHAARLGKSVVFAGRLPHDKLFALYGLADVLVMPSTGQEPFPLPVLEAFASAVPVVATTRGGLPEAVVDGETGLLVPADDGDALRDAIAAVLNDPELRERMGAAARARAVEHFSWEGQARKLLRYYVEAGA
jgi:glycosyltransferase involved in cell wall biosynthesis